MSGPYLRFWGVRGSYAAPQKTHLQSKQSEGLKYGRKEGLVSIESSQALLHKNALLHLLLADFFILQLYELLQSLKRILLNMALLFYVQTTRSALCGSWHFFCLHQIFPVLSWCQSLTAIKTGLQLILPFWPNICLLFSLLYRWAREHKERREILDSQLITILES